MNANLKGKKLLLLGGKPINSYEIVEYANKMGVYTIVTDFLPVEKSRAKQISAENWNISTADLDVLAQKVNELSIDGIYAGVHEFNLRMAMELCKRTNRPFYATQEQWNICTDKSLFKQTCRKYGLPVAKDYVIEDLDKIQYPVIVKPVDGSSGRGISICKNKQELIDAYALAMDNSEKKEVLIEEYLYGDEVVVFYTIINGVSKLSVMSDYYYNYDQERTMPLPQVYMYPSIYLDEYMSSTDALVREYISKIGLQNGTFFLQAFKNKNGFFFFEPGFRPGGSSVYKYTEILNGTSYISALVNYALLGNVGEADINDENPYFRKPCCTLSLVAKGGRVGSIKGYKEICELKEIIDSELRYDIGDYIPEKSALGQIIIRFFIVSDSIKQIKDLIVKIQNEVIVLDDAQNNMLISPFNVNLIKNV